MFNRWLHGLLYSVACGSGLFLASCQPQSHLAQTTAFIKTYRTQDQVVSLPQSQARIHYALDSIASDDATQPQKPVLVLLHGVNASYDTWNGWIAAGALQHYRVLRIDIPPFGLSSYDHPDQAKLQDTAKMLKELLDVLHLTAPVDIVGNSYGGYVAWSFAANFPQQVHKLVLIDASGYQKSAPFLINVAEDPILSIGYKMMSPCFVVSYFHKTTYGDFADERDPQTIQRYCALSADRVNRVAISQFYQHNADWQLTSFKSPVRPNAVQAPTLILWGKKDRLIDPADALLFQKDIVHSQVIFYDHLGHIPMEEDPKQTWQDVSRFLAD